MIQISTLQVLTITGFFAGACLSLIIFIYNNQSKRIDKIETIQTDCPVNKIYSIIEVVKTDVSWIKKTLEKKS